MSYLGSTISCDNPVDNLTMRKACGVTLEKDSACSWYAFSISGLIKASVANFVLFVSSLEEHTFIPLFTYAYK